MTSRDFCYWLQGFFEITDANNGGHSRSYSLNEAQVDMLKRHLALVFKHEIDPSYGDKKHQEELNQIHSGENQEAADSQPFKPPHGFTKPPIYRC